MWLFRRGDFALCLKHSDIAIIIKLLSIKVQTLTRQDLTIQ